MHSDYYWSYVWSWVWNHIVSPGELLDLLGYLLSNSAEYNTNIIMFRDFREFSPLLWYMEEATCRQLDGGPEGGMKVTNYDVGRDYNI